MHQIIWRIMYFLCLGVGNKRLSEDCGCQQGAQSNLSPAAAGAGGIGRGGTPVVGSSPAPFSGFGPTAGSQMTNNPGTGMSAAAVVSSGLLCKPLAVPQSFLLISVGCDC